MLIHLSPQFLLAKIPDKCSLLGIICPELGLRLTGGTDVVGRRPFPNKRYIVACRKEGGKPVHGLLIKANGHVPEFNVTTKWQSPDGLVLTHSVRHIVLDDEYDTVSENMLSWYAYGDGEQQSRWPKDSVYTSPACSQPRMDFSPDCGRTGVIRDTLDANGRLVLREEIFRLHTVPRERVLKPEFKTGSRMPFLSEAFAAKAV